MKWPPVCSEVIKEVERFCSNWMHMLLQALLLQSSAVDITHFVYNSLIVPSGASNHTRNQHVIYLDCFLSMLDIDHCEVGLLYTYIIR